MNPKTISVSEIIKKGWQLYRENINLFIVPLAILLLPYIILFLLEYIQVSMIYGIMLLAVAAIIFINIWLAVFFIKLIDDIYKKKQINTNKLYEFSFKQIPSYLLVSILSAIIVLAGLFLLIVPGIIFLIWYYFAPYINVLEEKNNKGREALKASKELVKGRYLDVLIKLLIPGLLVYFLVVVGTFIISYLIKSVIPSPIELSIIYNYLSTLIIIILSPLFTSFVIILYNDLKVKINN